MTNNSDKAEELLKRADEVDDPAGLAGVKKDGGRLVLLGKADMSGGVRETVRGGACCSGCTLAFVCLERCSQYMSEGQKQREGEMGERSRGLGGAGNACMHRSFPILRSHSHRSTGCP